MVHGTMDSKASFDGHRTWGRGRAAHRAPSSRASHDVFACITQHATAHKRHPEKHCDGAAKRNRIKTKSEPIRGRRIGQVKQVQ